MGLIGLMVAVLCQYTPPAKLAALSRSDLHVRLTHLPADRAIPHPKPHTLSHPAAVRSKLLPILLEWDMQQQGRQQAGEEEEEAGSGSEEGHVSGPAQGKRDGSRAVRQGRAARPFAGWAALVPEGLVCINSST